MCIRDRGYTELYTYSMISSVQMNQFNLDKTKAYEIANPLSVEWEYMRPSLWPSMPVSYTHLRAHETVLDLVCRLLLEKKKNNTTKKKIKY